MNKMYVAEPDAINMELARDLLAGKWEVVAGDSSFRGAGIEDCTALLIRSDATVTVSIKDTFPQLQHVIRVGVGVDNIDMDFCAREGIAVYNAPGANADAVSDYVVAMMLSAVRKMHLLTAQDVKEWNRFKFTGRSMASRSIGIIGFGHIGRQVFSKLQGFQCRAFFVYDPFVKKEDMPDGVSYATSIEEVLQSSDITTLHLPLLPATKYIINKEKLELMPEGAILINAARGGIVDEAELVQHLRGHELTYVADTVENEPHVSRELLNAPHVLITPHIASLTRESDDNMVAVALENFLNQRPMRGPA